MKRFYVGLLAVLLSGCATIFSGTTQDVEIRTTPGAKFTVTNAYGATVSAGEVGEDALARMNLVRKASYFSPQAYRVKLSKPGYTERSVAIDPSLNPWYFMNILIGGFVGMVIVDPLTGAMYRMVPAMDDAPLVATGENVSALQAESNYLKMSGNFPVSQFDYDAQQVIKPLRCVPLGNPVATKVVAGERLNFVCRDGRTMAVLCLSGPKCTVE